MKARSEKVAAARRASAIAFVGAGMVFASWVTRLPELRGELELSTAQLGGALAAMAIGSLAALPVAAWFIHRYGTRTVVRVVAAMATTGLVVIGIGYHAGILALIGGLFLLGFGQSAWNIAINVQGALVERHEERAILSRFHAGFSVGTVASALLGAGMISLGVPVAIHLCVVAVTVFLVVFTAVRSFLRDSDFAEEDRGDPEVRRGRVADRRTLLIGLVVVASAFGEGAGHDWITVTFVDDHKIAAALASLGYAAFLASMTLGRWMGPWLVNRYGRVRTIRGLSVLAIVGLLIFVITPLPGAGFAGVVMWGLGACLGYPTALSAAADDPRHAASRVSLVSGVGQVAYLGAPPMIGLLASFSSIQHALIVVPVLIGLSLLATSALAPTGRSKAEPE